MLYGCLVGVVLPWLTGLADWMLGTETEPEPSPVGPPKRIVILGGGFAGMTTAICLERELWGNPSVSVTLVSDQNSLLFTPMLAEIAGGSLEASHISTPLRSSLHRTEFVRGRSAAADFERRIVTVAPVGAGMGTARSKGTKVFALAGKIRHTGLVEVPMGMPLRNERLYTLNTRPRI